MVDQIYLVLEIILLQKLEIFICFDIFDEIAQFHFGLFLIRRFLVNQALNLRNFVFHPLIYYGLLTIILHHYPCAIYFRILEFCLNNSWNFWELNRIQPYRRRPIFWLWFVFGNLSHELFFLRLFLLFYLFWADFELNWSNWVHHLRDVLLESYEFSIGGYTYVVTPLAWSCQRSCFSYALNP